MVVVGGRNRAGNCLLWENINNNNKSPVQPNTFILKKNNQIKATVSFNHVAFHFQ